MSSPANSPQPADVCLARRRFLRRFGPAVAALAAGFPWTAGAGQRRAPLRTLPPSWAADLDLDGHITAADVALVRKALAVSRGFAIEPREGYEPRADLFARGRVGERDLVAAQQLSALGIHPPPRPVTVAWHYGWYHKPRRQTATVGFLGGDYVSGDPRIERQFNRLKNEFGVTVDALSYIAPRIEPRVLKNYFHGYARARNARSRHVALLYESGINLGAPDARIDFTPAATRNLLIDDFDGMGAFLRDLVDKSGSRPFEILGRPVVFLYASHTWVANPASEAEFKAVEEALDRATTQFAVRYGAPPFLIGEEMLLAPDDLFGPDRQRRSRNFDGIFAYHHASSPASFAPGELLGTGYAERRKEHFARAIEATREVRNRFTDEPLVLIPSLAAGFAKHGHPRLAATRAGYADFLWEMDTFLREVYFDFGELSVSARPSYAQVPIYTVGSWNEEFEGHALLPARMNGSLKRVKHQGFDLVLALKEVLGWNPYSGRSIGL